MMGKRQLQLECVANLGSGFSIQLPEQHVFKFGVFAESGGLKLSLSPTTRRWLMLTGKPESWLVTEQQNPPLLGRAFIFDAEATQ